MIQNLPRNIKVLLNSTLPLAGVIILFILVWNFGMGKISAIRSQLSQARADSNVLTQKLSLLETSAATAATNSSLTSTILPDKNPSLIILSQLKTLAAASSVSIGAVKGGAAVTGSSGLYSANVVFDAAGGATQLISFLNGIQKFAPISLVDKIKLSQSGGAGKATVSVETYWSPFPTKLPALTDQVSDLTADEKATLTKVSTLTPPVFSEVPAAASAGKTDPFSQ